VSPSDQRLDTRHFLSANVHLRLVLKEDFSVANGEGQFLDQLQRIDTWIILDHVMEHIPALLPSLEQGLFGPLEKANLVAVDVPRRGPADTEADHVMLTVEIEGLPENFLQSADRSLTSLKVCSFKGDSYKTVRKRPRTTGWKRDVAARDHLPGDNVSTREAELTS
jgi:hypothetical protein